jgi:hypothetical protein
MLSVEEVVFLWNAVHFASTAWRSSFVGGGGAMDWTQGLQLARQPVLEPLIRDPLFYNTDYWAFKNDFKKTHILCIQNWKMLLMVSLVCSIFSKINLLVEYTYVFFHLILYMYS